jgi:hypothetical protein
MYCCITFIFQAQDKVNMVKKFNNIIPSLVGEGGHTLLLEAGGVGSIPANSNAQNVPSFCRWRFEM